MGSKVVIIKKGVLYKKKIKAFFPILLYYFNWNIMGFEKRDDKITHIFFFSSSICRRISRVQVQNKKNGLNEMARHPKMI